MTTTFTSTTNGNINDGGTYGNTSPGVAGTDFPDSDDICVAGGSTTITLNVDYEVRALKITGTIAGGGNTITVNGATSNKPFDNDGTITGDLNVTITNTGLQQDDLLLDAMGTSGNINNLTLNLANGTTDNKTVGIASATTIDGNLTITSGTFDTTFDGGASQVLTVDGKTEITTGTLALNSSSCSFNSGGTLGGLVLNSNATVLADAGSTVTMGSIEAAYDSSINIRLAGTNTINNYRSSTDKTMKLPPGVVDPVSSTTSFTVTTSATNTEVSAVNLVDLTFTPASGTPNFNLDSGYGGIDIEGNITISAGVTITTNNQPFTIGKQCNLAGTLICGTTDVSVSSGLADGTGTLGMRIQDGGTLTGGSGDHTYGTFNADASGTVNATLTSGITTINGSYTDGIAWGMRNGVTFSNGGGDIHFTGTANQYLYERNNTARTLGDVTVNKSGGTLQWYNSGGAVYTMATLTVTAGTYSSAEHTSGTSKDLTVTGQVLVNGGTISLGAATCDFGNVSQSSGIIYGQTSTINLNSGTAGGWVWYRTGGTWDYGTSTVVYKENGKHMEGEFYNLTIECSSSTHTGVWRADGLASVIMKCANDLTVKEGIWKRDAAAETMTIVGDVSIESGGTLGQTSETGANSFNSLTNEGTFVASSGNTTILVDIRNRTGATFTHNGGTVLITTGATYFIHNTGSYSTITFNNLTYSGANSYLVKDIIVEGTFSNPSGYIRLTSGAKITLGTTTSQGTLAMGSNKLFPYATWYLYGASELYPGIVTGTNATPIKFSYGEGGANSANLKWLDIQFDINDVGGDDNYTITLDGSCEFDAVTVGSGDTLDLSGQRMYASGLLTISGDNGLKNTTDGSTQDTVAHLIPNGIIASTTTHHASLSNVVYIADQGTSSHKIEYFDFGTFASTRDGNLGFGRYGPDSSSTNVILANNGTMTNWGRTGSVANANSMNNLTIATGATAVPESATLTVAGDFTTSGGLIGKSAFEVTGTTYASGSSILDYSSASVTAITMSGWVKLDDVANGANNQFILRQNDNFIGLQADGSIYVGVELQNSASGYDYPAVITSNGTIGDDKWHHVAMTWASGSTLKAYMDGKLIGENTSISADYVRLRQRGAGQNTGVGGLGVPSLAGIIAQTCRWHTEKTPQQIRTEMFQDFSSLSSNTDCIYWYQFDTGTGTTVFDSTSADCDLTSQISNGTATASWAGAGTFTKGNSTIDMTGNGTINIAGGVTQFNNLKVAASGKTTTLAVLGGSSDIRFFGTLTHGGGTASSSGNPAWTMKGTATVSAGSDWSNWYLCYWESSTAVPAATWKYWLALTDSTLAGDMTCTGYFRPHQSVVDIGNHTLTTHEAIFHSTGGVNMGAGTITFANAAGLSSSQSDSVFTGGPGATVTGVAAKSTFMSQNNFAIVGKIENLDVTNEELKVTGQVINCTGDIHQYFPTIDHSQQLDADTADDRDVRLGRDLDKNTELINS